jgi:hypothetical protein
MSTNCCSQMPKQTGSFTSNGSSVLYRQYKGPLTTAQVQFLRQPGVQVEFRDGLHSSNASSASFALVACFRTRQDMRALKRKCNRSKCFITIPPHSSGNDHFRSELWSVSSDKSSQQRGKSAGIPSGSWSAWWRERSGWSSQGRRDRDENGAGNQASPRSFLAQKQKRKWSGKPSGLAQFLRTVTACKGSL